MTPAQVQQLCLDVLAKGPDIAAVDAWVARLAGVEVTFSSGARLWLAITTAGAEAVQAGAETTPSSSLQPLPQLYNPDGKIELLSAELYLAAVLEAAQAPEIARAYAYSGRQAKPKCPGVGLFLESGGRAFLPIAHTAPAGQGPAGRPFEQLHASF